MSEGGRVVRQALVLGAVSLLVAAAVRFPLIKRFVRGEFRQSFFQASEYPGVRLITLEEAEELWRTAQAAFIDARRPDLYDGGHVPGARSVPASEAEKAFPATAGVVVAMDARTGFLLALVDRLIKALGLLLFPLISGICCVLLLASFAIPLYVTGHWQPPGRDATPVHQMTYYGLLFLFYVCNYFVIVFFNAAIVACATIRLSGGHPSVADGFRAAAARLSSLVTRGMVDMGGIAEPDAPVVGVMADRAALGDELLAAYEELVLERG